MKKLQIHELHTCVFNVCVIKTSVWQSHSMFWSWTQYRHTEWWTMSIIEAISLLSIWIVQIPVKVLWIQNLIHLKQKPGFKYQTGCLQCKTDSNDHWENISHLFVICEVVGKYREKEIEIINLTSYLKGSWKTCHEIAYITITYSLNRQISLSEPTMFNIYISHKYSTHTQPGFRTWDSKWWPMAYKHITPNCYAV